MQDMEFLGRTNGDLHTGMDPIYECRALKSYSFPEAPPLNIFALRVALITFPSSGRNAWPWQLRGSEVYFGSAPQGGQSWTDCLARRQKWPGGGKLFAAWQPGSRDKTEEPGAQIDPFSACPSVPTRACFLTLHSLSVDESSPESSTSLSQSPSQHMNPERQILDLNYNTDQISPWILERHKHWTHSIHPVSALCQTPRTQRQHQWEKARSRVVTQKRLKHWVD